MAYLRVCLFVKAAGFKKNGKVFFEGLFYKDFPPFTKKPLK